MYDQNRKMKKKIVITLLSVFVFGVAFAFVEAAVVVYLRQLNLFDPNIGRDEIIPNEFILNVEKVREVATLFMLAAVAALAGGEWKQKLAYFIFVFSIWDIFYYIFLRLTIGWPKSLFDPDIFFLLPLPWVGPVFVPFLVFSLLGVASLVYLSRQHHSS